MTLSLKDMKGLKSGSTGARQVAYPTPKLDFLKSKEKKTVDQSDPSALRRFLDRLLGRDLDAQLKAAYLNAGAKKAKPKGQLFPGGKGPESQLLLSYLGSKLPPGSFEKLAARVPAAPPIPPLPRMRPVFDPAAAEAERRRQLAWLDEQENIGS